MFLTALEDTMPQPITITFDPESSKFEFSPETLRVPHGNQRIEFRLKTSGGGPAKATFDPKDGVHIKNGQGVFSTLDPGEKRWIEEDLNRATEPTRYEYKVAILYQGTRFDSPDPFIVNDPPILA